MGRMFVDCRDYPSEMNCTIAISADSQKELLEAAVAELGVRARLHWLATADHSYRILKRQRTAGPSVFEEMAQVTRTFVAEAP